MDFRISTELKLWRKQVFERDKYICQQCGYEKGRILEAHHIIPVSYLLRKYNIKTFEESKQCNELWDINNGITLCNEHHKLFHHIYGQISTKKLFEQFKKY
jgi:5-methylcytosine-specific restriction endonuclease McrA